MRNLQLHLSFLCWNLQLKSPSPSWILAYAPIYHHCYRSALFSYLHSTIRYCRLRSVTRSKNPPFPQSEKRILRSKTLKPWEKTRRNCKSSVLCVLPPILNEIPNEIGSHGCWGGWRQRRLMEVSNSDVGGKIKSTAMKRDRRWFSLTERARCLRGRRRK